LPARGQALAGAVGTDENLVHPWRQRRHGALHQTSVAAAGRDVAVPELIRQDHVLLGPERHHRLVAGPAVVGPARGPLLALENGGIDVDRRHRLRPPLLEKADQPATGLRQALQPLAFAWDLAGLALPQRWHRLVERLEEVTRGLRRRQAVPEQQRQRFPGSQGRLGWSARSGKPRARPPSRRSARRRRPKG